MIGLYSSRKLCGTGVLLVTSVLGLVCFLETSLSNYLPRPCNIPDKELTAV